MEPTDAPRPAWKVWGERVLWAAILVAGVALWAFPDAISRWRQASTDYVAAAPGCALAEGPCTASFADGASATLAVEPGVARATQPATLTVTTTGGLVPTLAELQGIEMHMGLVRVPLAPEGDAWRGVVTLPTCTIERMSWRVDVRVGERTAGYVLWMER